MTNLINTKVLLSGATILAAAALIVGATFAFFSDSETSEDNTFVAGSVDLKVDSTASYLGVNVLSGTWDEKDLTSEKFFNFNDIKPGDYGENTISLHVVDNDAWVCAEIDNMVDAENAFLQLEIDSRSDADGVTSGELAEGLNFFAWADGGDNIWQENEQELFSNLVGPASDVLNGVIYSLADSTTGGIPFTESTTNYIGLAWCAGDLTQSVGSGNMGANVNLNCDGSTLGNEAQTDSVTADITFHAVQYRNNLNFNCQDLAQD
ncbi:MAG: hypothetical protein A3A51_02485 [Candidatus Levybacteria bacterium RIFCSPLOWO2_01_FULL_39_10]|nr:MAG: hypothetical protein A3A51_02485 [Candidatus Levybacteria bacterium RIFCSPLOWO2_01_FULL_39_10]